jgi:hypothetical protein
MTVDTKPDHQFISSAGLSQPALQSAEHTDSFFAASQPYRQLTLQTASQTDSLAHIQSHTAHLRYISLQTAN